jgi:hypothetical protein
MHMGVAGNRRIMHKIKIFIGNVVTKRTPL